MWIEIKIDDNLQIRSPILVFSLSLSANMNVCYVVWIVCVVCLLSLSGGNYVRGSMGRHLICKNVGEVFLEHSGELPAESDIPGPPGKRGLNGERGRPGQRGPRGPSGKVDYGAINETMEEMVQNVMMDVNQRLKALELFTDRLREGLCQVRYNGKCFWAILSSVNFFEGQTMCIVFGGKVANIYDEKHYDMMVNYVRLMMPASATYTEPWIAMDLDTTTGMAMTPDGSTAPYLTWFPGYPRTGQSYSTHTKINLQVRKDVTSSTQGMWNYDPVERRDGVLCEI